MNVASLARSRSFAVGLLNRAQDGLSAARRRRADLGGAPSRGVAFAGTIWVGGAAQPTPGMVVLDSAGRVASIRLGLPDAALDTLPGDLLVLGGPQHWVVPGITDAHVHLEFDPAGSNSGKPTFGPANQSNSAVSGLECGLTAVRDLGAPLSLARRLQTRHRIPPPGCPFVASSGPMLTADGGYPSKSWGSAGTAHFLRSSAQARSVVQQLAADGVDLIKIAFEPGSVGWPVLAPDIASAVVRAAHSAGLPVVAHALRAELVSRALDCGVDELAHTPTERLSPALIERIAASGVSVTSTLQTFFFEGDGRNAAANAADLVAAGVQLNYGTDFGNAGTRPGVDPRELDRLADTGLGRLGALRAATENSAHACGMRLRTGRIALGEPASLVLLSSDPLAEPGVWRIPSAVFTDGRLTVVR